ncbi:hypothetical protein ONZ45_g12678 [Pleurotus djamor]|nr:hypothetical protein ONZ45_g12678 [Pleurotus djamor]
MTPATQGSNAHQDCLREKIEYIYKSYLKSSVLAETKYQRDFIRYEVGRGRHYYGTFNEEQIAFNLVGTVQGERNGSVVGFRGNHTTPHITDKDEIYDTFVLGSLSGIDPRLKGLFDAQVRTLEDVVATDIKEMEGYVTQFPWRDSRMNSDDRQIVVHLGPKYQVKQAKIELWGGNCALWTEGKDPDRLYYYDHTRLSDYKEGILKLKENALSQLEVFDKNGKYGRNVFCKNGLTRNGEYIGMDAGDA